MKVPSGTSRGVHAWLILVLLIGLLLPAGLGAAAQAEAVDLPTPAAQLVSAHWASTDETPPPPVGGPAPGHWTLSRNDPWRADGPTRSIDGAAALVAPTDLPRFPAVGPAASLEACRHRAPALYLRHCIFLC